MAINMLAKTVLSATRKGILRQRPVFKEYGKTSPNELTTLEQKIGMPLPVDLRDWLLTVGFGDVDDELSFRAEWFAKIEIGQLKGGAIFAQDIEGNFYAFDSSRGRIYYLSRSKPGFAPVAESFSDFLEELVRRDYKLTDWTDALETQKYDW